jgi:hypothetical protein
MRESGLLMPWLTLLSPILRFCFGVDYL